MSQWEGDIQDDLWADALDETEVVCCDCEYPHGNDFDPYNYENCTCSAGCYHYPKVEEVEG